MPVSPYPVIRVPLLLALALAVCGQVTAADSVAELRRQVMAQGRVITGFRLEGVVCDSNRRSGLLALQDDSGATALLRLPELPGDVRPGSRVRVEGEDCLVSRGELSINLGSATVVEVDGRHPRAGRAGEVWLEKGQHPLRVEWFNGVSNASLELEWEVPGRERIAVPVEAFSHHGPTGNMPGLDFSAYEGRWDVLPDFHALLPVATGSSAGLDLSNRSRMEDCGLVFSGSLAAPETGLYRFHLASDDGSRLRLGRGKVTCSVIGETAVPVSVPYSRVVETGGAESWVSHSGRVTWVSRSGSGLVMEVTGETATATVRVADAQEREPEEFRNGMVSVAGVKRGSGIVIMSVSDLQGISGPATPAGVLSHAEEIRRLRPAEARQQLRAQLEGVVTMVNTESLVMQDETGGVFIHYASRNYQTTPKVGQVWRVEGVTGAGDFSPVVFAGKAEYVREGTLPEPVRPAWDQLVSGILDAEQVEIEGVVISISEAGLRLLTREGVISILHDAIYPLPVLTEPQQAALPGSLVRLRGVYASSWDKAIGRVHPAQLLLGEAVLMIDEPAPADIFSAPLHLPSDLLRFTAQSSALKRVRIRAQLMAAKPPEYFLHDGTRGIRLVSEEPLPFQPGDEIEAAGFPRLSGPSPVLLFAQARRIGSSPLPAAREAQVAELSDPGNDSTRVQVTATVVGDTQRKNERALELQSGAERFFAYLPLSEKSFAPLERDAVVRLTGVCVNSSSDHALASPDPFELRLNGEAAIEVVTRGPWWTPQRLVVMISVLSGGLVLVLLWVTQLRRTVAKRSRELSREIGEREAAERQRAMEQERSRVAQDLHDELGSGLTEVGMLGSLLKNPAIPQEKKADYLNHLGEVCFTLVSGLDEIVWAVNPRYDSVLDLAGYFSLFAQRLLDLAGIRCRLSIDETMAAQPLDSRRRHGLFLAFREALNNTVRHSGAEEVQLVIAVREGMLEVSVADDGGGFERAGPQPGSDGLHGMQERMASLGGSCVIETAPGQGTTVRFTIPLLHPSL